MAAPTFKWVQTITSWLSGSISEWSTTSGAGATLPSLTGNLNYSSNIGPTGAQSAGVWSTTYPVNIGSNSYEFVFGLYVVTPADNNITNLQFWAVPFTAITGVTFFLGTCLPSAIGTPVTSNSTLATTNFTAINDVNTNALSVTAPYNAANNLSNPLISQARTTNAAAGGTQSVMPTIGVVLQWS